MKHYAEDGTVQLSYRVGDPIPDQPFESGLYRVTIPVEIEILYNPMFGPMDDMVEAGAGWLQKKLNRYYKSGNVKVKPGFSRLLRWNWRLKRFTRARRAVKVKP